MFVSDTPILNVTIGDVEADIETDGLELIVGPDKLFNNDSVPDTEGEADTLRLIRDEADKLFTIDPVPDNVIICVVDPKADDVVVATNVFDGVEDTDDEYDAVFEYVSIKDLLPDGDTELDVLPDGDTELDVLPDDDIELDKLCCNDLIPVGD